MLVVEYLSPTFHDQGRRLHSEEFAFDQSEFARRNSIDLGPGESIVLKSAEDTVLRKLLWYVQGGQVASTQWRDVIEVLRVSGPTLDEAYLSSWAAQLDLTNLLDRAWKEARI